MSISIVQGAILAPEKFIGNLRVFVQGVLSRIHMNSNESTTY